MSGSQLLILGATFVIVFGAALGAMIILRPNALQRRLERPFGTATVALAADTSSAAPEDSSQWMETIVRASSHVAKLSLPSQGWDESPLRIKFMNAGWRSDSAPKIYFAAKTVLALVLPLISMVLLGSFTDGMSRNTILFVAMLTAGIGFYLPGLVLGFTVKRRKQEIFENLPDALDLMTVCVEAGLGVDAAMLRVADELHVKTQALSDEFSLVLLELRAGSTRERALRKLATRTGVDDVDTLVSMLIQAERFGTSIGTALRVHTDMLRTKRRQYAEERAAKVALKLLFPLMFFIFPALLIVLLGPAVMQIVQVMGPAFAGVQ